MRLAVLSCDKFALFMSLCVFAKSRGHKGREGAHAASLLPRPLPRGGIQASASGTDSTKASGCLVYEFLNEIYQPVDAAELSAEDAEQL